jgi:prepilin-type N-terminal cleavage/methylation domain-containing protein
MQIRSKNIKNKKAGFTLIELLISVAIIGVLAAIGIPQYLGYVDNSKTAVVKNNLRAIYMQQQEYLQRNNVYYFTGTTCTSSNSAINTNLFAGQNILTTNEGFYYCITQTTTTDFTARAQESSTTRNFTITNLNVTNF